MNILVCDDDKEIVEAISIYLEQEGYHVLKAYDGIEALDIMRSYTVNTKEKESELHLLILDIMMPRLDGIHTMMKLREDFCIPVILLSAKSEDTDKILGLNAGADDYITKPFNPLELIARVKSQLRRYTQLGSISQKKEEEQNILVHGGLCMDKEKREVTVDGEAVKLTPTEYQILQLFMENPGIVFSSTQIYERVWKDSFVTDNAIAVHIRRIREKIEINPREPRYLKVMWGVGYFLEEK